MKNKLHVCVKGYIIYSTCTSFFKIYLLCYSEFFFLFYLSICIHLINYLYLFIHLLLFFRETLFSERGKYRNYLLFLCKYFM